jgi:hypothetical protein
MAYRMSSSIWIIVGGRITLIWTRTGDVEQWLPAGQHECAGILSGVPRSHVTKWTGIRGTQL